MPYTPYAPPLQVSTPALSLGTSGPCRSEEVEGRRINRPPTPAEAQSAEATRSAADFVVNEEPAWPKLSESLGHAGSSLTTKSAADRVASADCASAGVGGLLIRLPSTSSERQGPEVPRLSAGVDTCNGGA